VKVIEACALVQRISELPRDTVEVVNAVIRHIKQNNHTLPDVHEGNIEHFNDIFFYNLLSAYPDVQMINKDEEAGLCFVFRNGVFGLVYNELFYHF